MAYLRCEPGARRIPRPNLIGEAVILIGLLYVYDRVTEAVAAHRVSADVHGQFLLHIEHQLRLALEGPANAWIAAHHSIQTVAVGYYELMHVPLATLLLVWSYFWRPAVYRPARNALISINVVGLIVFMLYPVAPPRSLSGAGFVDSVNLEWVSPEPVDHFGALPSLHLAWAIWVAVVGLGFIAHPVLRLLLLLHPALTAFVVVATANHYVVDVAAGLALGLAITIVATRWSARVFSRDLVTVAQIG